MIDARAVRTCLLLAALVLGAPIAAVLFTSLTNGEAGSGPPASFQLEMRVPPRTPIASPTPPADFAAPSAPDTASSTGSPEEAAPAPSIAPAPAVDEPPTAPAATESGSPSSVPPRATATGTPRTRKPTATAPTTPDSVFHNRQVIAFYGSPISDDLGVLGMFPPDQLAEWLQQESAIYDRLNGDRGVTPALDLIYAQAQSDPTENGLYLRYLDDGAVNTYLDFAEKNDTQLILDLQIGRGDLVGEVRKIARYLRNPRVHVAIDPEYAVGPEGEPIVTPGMITGHEINDVEDYLQSIVEKYKLPPKMLIIHQYMDDTITEGEVTKRLDDVDLVLNMDGFGTASDKAEKYHKYGSRAYATYRSFNVFLKQDDPVWSEEQIMSMNPQPDMVIYQ